MPSVCKVTLDIEVRKRLTVATDAAVASWYDPSLDHTIIACGANFGLGWTSTSSENDRPNHVKMSPQCEANLEIGRLAPLISGQFSYLMGTVTPSPRHSTGV